MHFRCIKCVQVHVCWRLSARDLQHSLCCWFQCPTGSINLGSLTRENYYLLHPRLRLGNNPTLSSPIIRYPYGDDESDTDDESNYLGGYLVANDPMLDAATAAMRPCQWSAHGSSLAWGGRIERWWIRSSGQWLVPQPRRVPERRWIFFFSSAKTYPFALIMFPREDS